MIQQRAEVPFKGNKIIPSEESLIQLMASVLIEHNSLG